MEFRHASWFVDEVYDRLGRANVALCEAESDKLETPELPPPIFAISACEKPNIRTGARKTISNKVTEAARRGDVFVYFKHEETPEGALYAERLLRE